MPSTVTVNDTAQFGTQSAAGLRGGVAVTDTVSLGQPGGDALGWSYSAVFAIAVNDLFRVRTTALPNSIYAALVRETISLRARLLSGGSSYRLTINERVQIIDRTRTALRTTVASAISLSEAMASKLGTKWTDKISLAAALVAQTAYNVKAIDAMKLRSFAGYGLLLFASDQIGVHSRVTPIYRALAALQDEVELDDAGVATLRILVIHEDAVEIEEGISVQSLLNLVLRDNIEIVVDISDPGGGGTTWAMNLRTGAVTSYSNYMFTSYAEAGGQYYGATDDGLYLLDGNDDSGTPIVATISGGEMELTGPLRTGFKAAYLALRGDGDFFIKLESAEQTTLYRAHPRNMRTTRVNLGKGWRSRYITWTLTSVGQEFDLSGLEFLPIAMRRTG